MAMTVWKMTVWNKKIFLNMLGMMLGKMMLNKIVLSELILSKLIGISKIIELLSRMIGIRINVVVPVILGVTGISGSSDGERHNSHGFVYSVYNECSRPSDGGDEKNHSNDEKNHSSGANENGLLRRFKKTIGNVVDNCSCTWNDGLVDKLRNGNIVDKLRNGNLMGNGNLLDKLRGKGDERNGALDPLMKQEGNEAGGKQEGLGLPPIVKWNRKSRSGNCEEVENCEEGESRECELGNVRERENEHYKEISEHYEEISEHYEESSGNGQHKENLREIDEFLKFVDDLNGLPTGTAASVCPLSEHLSSACSPPECSSQAAASTLMSCGFDPLRSSPDGFDPLQSSPDGFDLLLSSADANENKLPEIAMNPSTGMVSFSKGQAHSNGIASFSKGQAHSNETGDALEGIPCGKEGKITEPLNGESKVTELLKGRLKSFKNEARSFTNWKRSPKEENVQNPPLGFKNLGNTCYINVILQALYSNEKFIEIVETFESCSSAEEPLFHSLNAFHKSLQLHTLDRKLQTKEECASVSPSELVKILASKNGEFFDGTAQEVLDFFTILTEELGNENQGLYGRLKNLWEVKFSDGTVENMLGFNFEGSIQDSLSRFLNERREYREYGTENDEGRAYVCGAGNDEGRAYVCGTENKRARGNRGKSIADTILMKLSEILMTKHSETALMTKHSEILIKHPEILMLYNTKMTEMAEDYYYCRINKIPELRGDYRVNIHERLRMGNADYVIGSIIIYSFIWKNESLVSHYTIMIYKEGVWYNCNDAKVNEVSWSTVNEKYPIMAIYHKVS